MISPVLKVLARCSVVTPSVDWTFCPVVLDSSVCVVWGDESDEYIEVLMSVDLVSGKLVTVGE